MVVFAIHQHESAMGVHVSPHHEPPSHLPPHPIPLGWPRESALSARLHASNLYWSSLLHRAVCMFQCYSLKSSHPHLLPQSPKVCSLHLCLFLLSAYRVIIYHLSKFYIYALIYCIGVSLSDISLCIIGPVSSTSLELTQKHSFL